MGGGGRGREGEEGRGREREGEGGRGREREGEGGRESTAVQFSRLTTI